jgi:hypothetical protein
MEKGHDKTAGIWLVKPAKEKSGLVFRHLLSCDMTAETGQSGWNRGKNSRPW